MGKRVELQKGDIVKVIKDGTGERLGYCGEVVELDMEDYHGSEIQVDFGRVWFSRDELRKKRE